MRRLMLAYAIGAMALSSCNCDPKPPVIAVSENYVLVPGSPAVDTTKPTVDQQSTSTSDVFRINVTRQCDTFTQNAVRKVDILWVVDSSGSMAPHQRQLANNFQAFINKLMPAVPDANFIPIDFHIGVVTTDTDDPKEQGQLHPFNLTDTSGALHAGPFIQCSQDQRCNVDGQASVGPSAQVQQAFQQMATVGTLGSSVERGLYAPYLALNRSENVDPPGDLSGNHFIRNDAALYIIVVSDEDDSSCSPNVSYQASGKACTNDPGCHCADDDSLSFGTTAFYSRFFETYKGYGHGDEVAFAGIIGTPEGFVSSQVPNNTDPHLGCQGFDPQDGTTLAYSGSRYRKVITDTVGAEASICATNFGTVLNNLAFSITGLKSDFKLTRGPDVNSLEIYVTSKNDVVSPPCQNDNDCFTVAPFTSCQNSKCAQPVEVTPSQDETKAQFVRCQGSVYRDIVHFGNQTIPNALNTIEVCYNVDPQPNLTCP